MEFLETFETHHNLRNNSAPDHIVTKEEFIEYYNNVSSSVDNDQYFELMINNSWKINDGDRSYGKGWSNADEGGPKKGAPARGGGVAAGGRNAQSRGGAPFGTSAPAQAASKGEEGPPMNYSEAQLMEQFRKKLAARGARGIMGLGRQFKIADDDRSHNLDIQEFVKAVHDFRVGLNEKDSQRLFNIFDRDRSGTIDYDEFLRGVRGSMNAGRAAICKKAFAIMDKDKSGILDISDIKQSYNAKMHPDVKSGKKTEDEILCEFLDTFEQHYAMQHPESRDSKIDMDEWLEYYNNVSMSIDRDDYFQLMMNQTWNLDGSRVTKKGWGAEI